MPNDFIRQALDAAADGNVAQFQTHINDALLSKVRDRLDLKRIEIASSLFNTEPKEDDNVAS